MGRCPSCSCPVTLLATDCIVNRPPLIISLSLSCALYQVGHCSLTVQGRTSLRETRNEIHGICPILNPLARLPGRPRPPRSSNGHPPYAYPCPRVRRGGNPASHVDCYREKVGQGQNIARRAGADGPSQSDAIACFVEAIVSCFRVYSWPTQLNGQGAGFARLLGPAEDALSPQFIWYGIHATFRRLPVLSHVTWARVSRRSDARGGLAAQADFSFFVLEVCILSPCLQLGCRCVYEYESSARITAVRVLRATGHVGLEHEQKQVLPMIRNRPPKDLLDARAPRLRNTPSETTPPGREPSTADYW